CRRLTRRLQVLDSFSQTSFGLESSLGLNRPIFLRTSRFGRVRWKVYQPCDQWGDPKYLPHVLADAVRPGRCGPTSAGRSNAGCSKVVKITPLSCGRCADRATSRGSRLTSRA